MGSEIPVDADPVDFRDQAVVGGDETRYFWDGFVAVFRVVEGRKLRGGGRIHEDQRGGGLQVGQEGFAEKTLEGVAVELRGYDGHSRGGSQEGFRVVIGVVSPDAQGAVFSFRGSKDCLTDFRCRVPQFFPPRFCGTVPRVAVDYAESGDRKDGREEEDGSEKGGEVFCTGFIRAKKRLRLRNEAVKRVCLHLPGISISF